MVKLIFYSSSALLPSFFLPSTNNHQTPKHRNSHHQHTVDCDWILGWEWRTWDTDRLKSSVRFFFFFLLFFFTNLNYRYITFTGTITTAITGPATSLTTAPAVSATAVAPAAAGGATSIFYFILFYLFYYTNNANNDRYQNWMTTPPIQQHNNSIGGDRSSGSGAAGRAWDAKHYCLPCKQDRLLK